MKKWRNLKKPIQSERYKLLKILSIWIIELVINVLIGFGDVSVRGKVKDVGGLGGLLNSN